MRPQMSPLVVSLLLLPCFGLQFADAVTTDTIRPGQSLNRMSFISSAKGSFCLRFTSFGNSKNIYVVISPNCFSGRAVWIANREQPFVNSSTVLTFNQEGNLVISDGRSSHRVTTTTAGNDTYARLLDTGNLILTNRADEVLWQSFDYPSNVLLPGMKLKDAKTGWSLVSWKSIYDPTPGPFSLHLSSQKELVLMEGSKPYWSSPLVGDLVSIFVIDGDYVTWHRNYTNPSSIVGVDCHGNVLQETYSQNSQTWGINNLLSKCAGNSVCVDFNICNETLDSLCDGLPGFTSGINKCGRNIELECNNSTKVQKDRFLSRGVLPRDPQRLQISNTSNCRSKCSENCSCTGYAYDQEGHCFIWSGPLLDLKQVTTDYVYQTYFYLKLATLNKIEETKSASGIVTVPEYENSKVRGNKKIQKIVIPTASIAVLFTMGLFVYHVMIKLRSEGEDLLLLDLGMTQKVNTAEHRDNREKDVQMPLFSFASVCSATDNFSATNKLGESGLGPVYKGKLLKGDEVAIKRLLKRSGQGWGQLKNEAMLIAKL